MVFNRIKKAFSSESDNEFMEDEYLEIDLEQEKRDSKVMVKLFSLNSYEDSNLILNSLREGYTIAVIDIKNLKKKDPIELKRAISKIKKTVDALEGSIAGFGENTVIVTPAFANISKEIVKVKEESQRRFEDF
jgi:SepF-like predicted cell division protein (DUF552 family)